MLTESTSAAGGKSNIICTEAGEELVKCPSFLPTDTSLRIPHIPIIFETMRMEQHWGPS